MTAPTADIIDRYLAAKSCTLWADWDIRRPDRRKLAAEWLAKEIGQLQAFMNEERDRRIAELKREMSLEWARTHGAQDDPQ